MKRIALMAVASGMALAIATPASAVLIPASSAGLMFDPFNIATQGTQLAFANPAGVAVTFAGNVRTAVYLNTSGTLDFYYQVFRTGAGTGGDEMIDAFTAANFAGFTVNGFSYGTATGGFAATNNPGGSTTTTGRNVGGGVLQTNFGTNGLMGTENSAIYIFRTNAVNYTTGTIGVIDGSTFTVAGFAPTAAVPEPATWGMMIAGFGLLGGVMRRRKTTVAFA